MTREVLKPGVKFCYDWLPNEILTIIRVTESRVVYTDGKKHSCGGTNRRVKSSWMSIHAFLQGVSTGHYVIVQ